MQVKSGDIATIRLNDEAPKIGSGFRVVKIKSIGSKCVKLADTSKPSKVESCDSVSFQDKTKDYGRIF